VSEEAKVAGRLMGVWEKDPFTREVNLDKPWGCPLLSGTTCAVANKRGIRKEWILLVCPTILKNGKRGGAPPECPLRFGSVTVRARE
jgi:hypothetical protein